MTRAAFTTLLLAALTLATHDAAGQPGPVQTVPSVDLNRYLGDWHEVARLPNRFQDQCVGDVRVTYDTRPDGRLDVINRCRKQDGTMDVARGVARVVDERTNARLQVRFAPAWLSFIGAVWGNYWIIGLDPDYRWAVVGEPDRRYLWVLSRTPALDAAAFKQAMEIATSSGYDLSRLQRTDNTNVVSR